MKRTAIERRTRLKAKSDRPSRKAAEAALEEAKAEARERWGHVCAVHPHRPGWHLHHGLPKGSHPFLRAVAENLVPLCRECHALADRPDHWLHWACREIAGERLAAKAGRRPYPEPGEIVTILNWHLVDSARPHVSSMGRSD